MLAAVLHFLIARATISLTLPQELLKDWEDIYHMSPDCLKGRDQNYIDAVRKILVETSRYNESKWRRSIALAKLFITNPKFAYQRVQGRLFDNWNRRKAATAEVR